MELLRDFENGLPNNFARDDLTLELIIVDDCSRDNSPPIAQKLAVYHPEIKAFQHKNNRGRGAALRTGIAHAMGEFVGIQDTDMEHDPQDLHVPLEPLPDNKADVAFEARYLDTRRVIYLAYLDE